MLKKDLDAQWKVRAELLEWGPEMSAAVLKRTDGWYDSDLPCDIHIPLIAAGKIKEPLEKDNCFSSEWTESRSWWFLKTFETDSAVLGSDVIELTLESLDAEADIFLNGWHIGHQKSAFYPFTLDVKKYLTAGENVLLVRLSSGAEYFSDNDLAGFKRYVTTEYDGGRSNRGDKRRIFLRKPQYVYGWDWGPKVVTCGIVKGAWLTAYDKLAVRSVYARTLKVADTAEVRFDIEIENLHAFSTLDASLSLEVGLDGKKVLEIKRDVFLRSGGNYVEIVTEIPDAQLWWPNGMGAQPLYTINVTASADTAEAGYPEFKFGIRTLEINQEKLDQQGSDRKFAVVINGIEVFCKGGNWVPADSIYARVTDEKYDTLVRQARDANFNMLRVWGGGLYERDIFYRKCDEYGIMLWHDMMFACGLYPDNLAWFKNEVEKELDYQTSHLKNHVSMTIWCGNNENHWAFDEWYRPDGRKVLYGGDYCYNRIAPAAVQKNCPHIPYWNSSPYGGVHPNGNEAGDRHHWFDCTMNPEMEKRISPEEYDKVSAKFVSEYGYIGPCAKSSILRYHSDIEPDRNGPIWQLHNNTFEKGTVTAGINKHYTDPDKLDMDGYLHFAGLCQGLMLGYSLESMRFKDFCGGALFWMYNDCWGEIGWTIIDYYLKRKISYYIVKRAFAPLKLIMREIDGMIRVMGANDTSEALKTDLEYGYVSFDGSSKLTETVSVELLPHFRDIVLEFKKGEYDSTCGIYFVRPLSTGKIDPAVLNQGRFKDWIIPESRLKVTNIKRSGCEINFTVSSETYTHAVHFGLGDDIELSDEYFDLLPGCSKKITICGALADRLQFDDIKAKGNRFC